MSGETWVLDVTFWRDGEFVFCPLKPDGTVVSGLAVIGGETPPRGGLVAGYFHSDGLDAVQEWIAGHPDVVDRLTGAV